MSQYTYIIVQGWAESIEILNDAIRCGGYECFHGLTSAEQIISISKAGGREGYDVFWRVREWLDGRTE